MRTVQKDSVVSALINGDGSIGRCSINNSMLAIRCVRRSVGSYYIAFPTFKVLYSVTALAIGGNCVGLLAGGMGASESCWIDDFRIINMSGTLVDIGYFLTASGVSK